jgi:putative DNA primase/helicase
MTQQNVSPIRETTRLYDPVEIRRALNLLHEYGQVFECRVLSSTTYDSPRFKCTRAGYFENTDESIAKLFKELSKLKSFVGIYFTPQACHPDLLDSICEELQQVQTDSVTSNKDITHYRELLIDCDPDRHAKISSTDVEHEAAQQRAKEIRDYLRSLGFPDPIEGDSGNGWHLVYRVNLPNETEISDKDNGLMVRVLKGIHAKFSAVREEGKPYIKQDLTVGNPARVWKLYGTLACKGSNTARRPHRMSRITDVPETIEEVSRDLLEMIAVPLEEKKPQASTHTKKSNSKGDFDSVAYIEDILREHNIEHKPKQPWNNGGWIWKLKQCWSDPSHVEKDAYITVDVEGIIGAGCFHNSCVGKKWPSFKAHYGIVTRADLERLENYNPTQDTPSSNGKNGHSATSNGTQRTTIDTIIATKDTDALFDAVPQLALLSLVNYGKCKNRIKEAFGKTLNMNDLERAVVAERNRKRSSSERGQDYSQNVHAPDEVPLEVQLCQFTDDDAGNGDAMELLAGQDYLYSPARGWFFNTETHWKLDPEGAEARKTAVDTLRTRRHAAVELDREAIVKCTKGEDKRVNGCINRFKTLVNISFDEFDNDPDALNCRNGVVNLRTGEVIPHDRDQRFTYCLPVEHKPGASSQEWIDYLGSVVGGGQDVIDYLQMALGYSLTGHTREEILFYLFGPPRSGKGTLAEIFMRLMPDPIATMVDFNSFTAKREGDVSNFDLAPLKPSRMIFASESNRSQSLNPAKIKQLTGGDSVRACFKHKDFFSYRPQFKVWMMSNHSVNGDPEDDALWGRVRVIEFPNSFLGLEDKAKKERLKQPDALEAVLAWAIEGSRKWYALGSSGLIAPSSVVDITRKHRDELDYVQQWIDEACEVHDVWSASEDVAKSYTAWCKNNNVSYIKNPKELSQSLKAKGFTTGVQRKVEGKNKKGVEGLYVYPLSDEDEKGNR